MSIEKLDEANNDLRLLSICARSDISQLNMIKMDMIELTDKMIAYVKSLEDKISKINDITREMSKFIDNDSFIEPDEDD